MDRGGSGCCEAAGLSQGAPQWCPLTSVAVAGTLTGVFGGGRECLSASGAPVQALSFSEEPGEMCRRLIRLICLSVLPVYLAGLQASRQLLPCTMLLPSALPGPRSFTRPSAPREAPQGNQTVDGVQMGVLEIFRAFETV